MRSAARPAVEVPQRRLVIVVRPRAQRDLDDAVDQSLVEAGLDIAVRFGEAVIDAFDLLARNPGIGSPRYSTLLGLPVFVPVH